MLLVFKIAAGVALGIVFAVLSLVLFADLVSKPSSPRIKALGEQCGGLPVSGADVACVATFRNMGSKPFTTGELFVAYRGKGGKTVATDRAKFDVAIVDPGKTFTAHHYLRADFVVDKQWFTDAHGNRFTFED